MKYIPCAIETFRDRSEDYWQITVSSEHAAEAALEFSALHLGRSEKIVFADGCKRFTICLGSVTLGQRAIAVDKNWPDAVWCLFLDTHRSGWTSNAHIDQDFSDAAGSICITIAITL